LPDRIANVPTPELSKDQYEAIGRLAIAVNEFEAVIDACLEQFVFAKIGSIGALAFNENRGISQKRDLLAAIAKSLIKSHPSVKTKAEALLTALPRCKDLIAKRNSVVHAQIDITAPSGPALRPGLTGEDRMVRIQLRRKILDWLAFNRHVPDRRDSLGCLCRHQDGEKHNSRNH
jgi:hypothetical protein